MISNISGNDFEKRLKANVELGNIKVKGTPFHMFYLFVKSDKMFFGTYGKNKFEITENFGLLFPNTYRISGDYKSKSNNQTEVNYQFKPLGFVYYWFKIMPLAIIPLFNLILYFQVKSASYKDFVIANSIMICLVFFSCFYMWLKKRKFENIFKEVFEIEK
ncbi:MAG TPA: hypothetical protein PLH25_06980 [Flavobacterium sp.]|nr:hypothetical protein [Flavobacterium sp.]